MITKSDRDIIFRELEDQRELIQNDLDCILDGLEDEYGHACETVAARFDIIIEKLNSITGDEK